MFVCGIFFLQLLLSLYRKWDAARGWLAVWAFAATVLYGCHFVFFHHSMTLMPVSDTVYVVCNLLVYPLFLIYIYVLTEAKWPHWMMGVLGMAVAAGVVVGVLYAQMTPTEVEQFVREYLYQGKAGALMGVVATQSVVHFVCRILFAAEVVWVVVAGTYKIRRYNELVRSVYADTDDKTLGHISVLLWLLIFTSSISLVANTLGRCWFAESVWLLTIPALCFSVLLFGIGWTGLWQQFSMSDVLKDEQEALSTQSLNSGKGKVEPFGEADDDDMEPRLNGGGRKMVEELAERLERIVEDQQIYLRPGLKLDELANQMGTNRTYLQQALREVLHTTFSEYINRLRIAYAEKLMADHPDIKKEDLATRSGYVSLSSFYRNFHQFRQK